MDKSPLHLTTLLSFKKALLPLAMAPIILAGCSGADGQDGSPGRDGINGIDGAPGLDGIDGQDGAPGIDGVDGQDGAAGRDGIDGQDGAPGRDGIDGQDGAPGIDGVDGQDGAPGRDGIDGQDGAPGRDGIDGADAVLPTPTPIPTPVPLPPTTRTINLSGSDGGVSSVNDGFTHRSGGGLTVNKRANSGDIVFSNAVRVTNDYTLRSFTPDLGLNPLIVSSDLTIASIGSSGEPEAGVYYISTRSPRSDGIFLSDGDGIAAEPEERVTGLMVAENATLTFDNCFADPAERVVFSVRFVNDLHLAGSIELIGGFGGISLQASSFLGNATGEIDVSEDTGTERPGSINISTEFALINASRLSANALNRLTDIGPFFIESHGLITLSAGTILQNSGDISAVGGNASMISGEDGGSGGTVFMASDVLIYNSGDIDVSGGSAIADDAEIDEGEFQQVFEEGGSGGRIVFNSGVETEFEIPVVTNPRIADGGITEIIQEGNLILNGGSVASNNPAGTIFSYGGGGTGGTVEIDSRGADIYLGGSVSAVGGGALDGGGSTVPSGNGGGISINVTERDNAEALSITIASDIDLSGGDTNQTGRESSIAEGSGGTIFIDVEANHADIVIEALSIDISGGDHPRNGGPGGFFTIRNESNVQFNATDIVSSSSSILLETDINISSGEDLDNIDSNEDPAVSGDFDITGDEPIHGETRTLTITGDITSIGNSDINLYAFDSITISGDIINNGQNSNSAGSIEIETNGLIRVEGDVLGVGGSGGTGTTGGNGSEFTVTGEGFTTTGVISLNGGDANPDVSSSLGGNGGRFQAFITNASNIPVDTSSVSVSPGDGQIVGDFGEICDGLRCFTPRENNEANE